MAVGRFAAVISLQGIEDVYSKLKGLGPAGEQAMRSLDSAVQNVKLDGLGQSVTRASGAVGEFRDGLHILHPILRVAGIEMGNFSAFSRAAGAGMAGLAAAVGAAAIVKLVQFSSEISNLKVNLEGLLQSKDVANQVFAKLEEAAKKSKIPVQELAPIYQSLVRTQQELASKTGGPKIISLTEVNTATHAVEAYTTGLSLAGTKQDDLVKASVTLSTAFRNFRVPTDQAAQAIAQFGEAAAKNGGKITGDMIRQLQKASDGAANVLAQLAGKGNATAWAAELDKINGSFKKLVDDVVRNGDNIKAKTPSISQAFGDLWESIKRKMTPSEDLSDAIAKQIENLADSPSIAEWILSGGIQKAWSELTTLLTQRWTEFVNGLQPLWEGLSWDNLFTNVSNAWDTVVNALQTSWQNFLAFLQANPAKLDVSGTGGNIVAPTGAQGGLLRGPGTSTSDSILARLSTGEFVVRAKAVQWYGADLLRAINSMRLPRDFMRGFNMGGLVDDMVRSLVPGAIPRFAAGGLASGNMRPVILNINGQQFGGLQGTLDAVGQLERFAVLSNLRATGRSPGWNK